MRLNEKIIKLYNEEGEAQFYKEIMRAGKVVSRSGDYKHIRIVDMNTGEHAILQFKKKTFKMLSGSNQTHYFNQ